MSDIDTVVVDSLKTLDPKRPIREGDIAGLVRIERPPPLAAFSFRPLVTLNGGRGPNDGSAITFGL